MFTKKRTNYTGSYNKNSFNDKKKNNNSTFFFNKQLKMTVSFSLSISCMHAYNLAQSFLALTEKGLSPFSPVGWGCRIHQLYLCRGVRHPLNKYPGYGTKQSDGEALVMLELWGMQCTLLLPSLPCPLWLGVVVPKKVLSMGQIELFYI